VVLFVLIYVRVIIFIKESLRIAVVSIWLQHSCTKPGFMSEADIVYAE